MLFEKPCHIWCNHPFSQRNKAAKIAVRVETGGEGEGEGGWTKFEKGG